MDPLTAIGAVASICQLAQTALSLSKTLYTLGTAIASASDDIQILADDLKTFSQSLTLLSRLLEDSKAWYSDDIYLLTAKVIKDCAELYFKIDKILVKLGGNGKSSWKLRVKFVYKEGEIRKLLKRLRDMKGTLATILMSLQVDLQLSLLNISGTSKIQRPQDKALQPETLKTLQEAQEAVENSGTLPKYTKFSEQVMSGSEKLARRASDHFEGSRASQPNQTLNPSHHSTKALIEEGSSLQSNKKKLLNTSSITESFVMLPSQPQIQAMNAKIENERSLKSSSSSESFKSAISMQEVDIEIARKVKAVQSVMHAFQTALETLENLMERRVRVMDEKVCVAARTLKQTLIECHKEIDEENVNYFKEHGHLYINSLSKNSAVLRDLSSNIMTDVVMKLHEYSAEHEDLEASQFTSLTRRSYIVHSSIIHSLSTVVIVPKFSPISGHILQLNSQTPPRPPQATNVNSQQGLNTFKDPPEMSLPFIGYTFKRFDDFNKRESHEEKPTQTHNQRPIPRWDSTKDLPTMQSGMGDPLDFAANKANSSSETTCKNCFVQTTPYWRYDSEGHILCNACGLFLELHGVDRPLSLKSDVVKKRNRGPSTVPLRSQSGEPLSEIRPALPYSPERSSDYQVPVSQEYALREYQMQKMLLEQLSKRRKLAAAHESGNNLTPDPLQLQSKYSSSPSKNQVTPISPTANRESLEDFDFDSFVHNDEDGGLDVNLNPVPPQSSAEIPTYDFAGQAGSIAGERAPIYLNAKQFRRICQRRIARQQQEEKLRWSKKPNRLPGLHSSTNPALTRRPRNKEGRYLTTDEIIELERKTKENSVTEEDMTLKVERDASNVHMHSSQPEATTKQDKDVNVPEIHAYQPKENTDTQEPVLAWTYPALSSAQTSKLWWQAFVSLNAFSSDPSPTFTTLSTELQVELDINFRLGMADHGICDRISTKLDDLEIILGKDIDNPNFVQSKGIIQITKTVKEQLGLEIATLGWGCCISLLSASVHIPRNMKTLPILHNAHTQLLEITGMIARYAVMENLYLSTSTTNPPSLTIKSSYRSQLISLCSTILEFFASSFTLLKVLGLECNEEGEHKTSSLLSQHQKTCDELIVQIRALDDKAREFRVVVDIDDAKAENESEEDEDDDVEVSISGMEEKSDGSWVEVDMTEAMVGVEKLQLE